MVYLPESPRVHTCHQIAPSNEGKCFEVHFAQLFWLIFDVFFWGGDPLTYTYLTLLWLKWQNSSFDSFNRGPRKGEEKLSSIFQISNWHLILASLRVLQTFDPILKSWKISFAAHHKVCTSIISEYKIIYMYRSFSHDVTAKIQN